MRITCGTIVAVLFLSADLAAGAIRRVPSEFPTIQTAIDAAHDGDTVLVADSTYYENITFRGKAITVASYYVIDQDTAHIDSTIIDGSRPANPDIASTVSFISGEDTTSVLCGMTVTGGTGSLNPAGYRVGGGVWVKAGSGARICHNRIISNTVSSNTTAIGGGVLAGSPFQAGGWLVLEDNEISSNTVTGSEGVGGAGVSCALHARIQRNRIENNEGFTGGSGDDGAGISCCTDVPGGKELLLCGNTVSGNKFTSTGVDQYGQSGLAGGMSVVGYRGIVEHNVITENELEGPAALIGGGVMLSFCSATLEFRNNWVSGNRLTGNGEQRGGGVCVWSCNPRIYNNIVVGNKGKMGGGVYVGGDTPASRPHVINNTMCGNWATLGSGIYSAGAYPVVLNSIVWNEGADIYQSGGLVTVQYSDIRGSWPDTGNIDVDPMFLDTTYQLSNSSPCIGAGVDSTQIGGIWYHAPSFCFFGGPRPNPTETKPDMGACENPLATDINEEQRNLPLYFALHQNYPNPFNPSTVISYQLPVVSDVKLVVFDILGREVATLVDGVEDPGYKSVEWNAAGVASGVYFYQLQAGDFLQTRKLLVLR